MEVGHEAPAISVVIPTFNRVAMLRRVLQAYEHQEPSGLTFELVVVDDGSTDGTWDLLAQWRSRRFSLRCERQVNAGPAAARNRALARLCAPIALFTGDDIEPAPDLLAQHLDAHRRWADPDLAVLGLTRWPDGMPLSATMRHVDGPGAEQFSYHYMLDGTEYDFRHFYTSNVSIQRSLLECEPEGFCTGFPAAAFEDAELAYRLSGHGLRIRFHAAAVGWHHHPYTASGFFRRQLACGAMARVLWSLWPRLKRWLSLDELEWTRIEQLGASPDHRRRVAEVAACLDLWESRAVSLAEMLDHLPDSGAVDGEPSRGGLGSAGPVDGLLLALFRYGYLRGLAAAHLEEQTADLLSAALFLRLLPPAVDGFSRAMSRLGNTFPRGAARVISDLGRVAPSSDRALA